MWGKQSAPDIENHSLLRYIAIYRNMKRGNKFAGCVSNVAESKNDYSYIAIHTPIICMEPLLMMIMIFN